MNVSVKRTYSSKIEMEYSWRLLPAKKVQTVNGPSEELRLIKQLKALEELFFTVWLAEQGFQPTQIIDRQYFTAIYFREFGEILFEIATDPPGFERDEPFESLGEKLMLPEWFEPKREEIKQGLPLLEIRILEGDI